MSSTEGQEPQTDTTAEPIQLPKYARGPLEIMRHANSHYVAARNSQDPYTSDIDRRVALIGFDNAIEVTLQVFIEYRGDASIKKMLNTPRFEKFHEKLNYLDRHIAVNIIQCGKPLVLLLNIHLMRNDLYHKWADTIPSFPFLEEARGAAVDIFTMLFDYNPESLLQPLEPQVTIPTATVESQTIHTTAEIAESATENAILFYGPDEHPYGCFSNFSQHPFRLDGKWWPTVEHFYQAQKFIDDKEYDDRIRHASTPSRAKQLGGSRRRPYRSDWSTV